MRPIVRLEVEQVGAESARCPKTGNRHPMQIVCKGNDLRASVKHHTTDPALLCRIGQDLETAKILSLQSGASLNLDANEVSRRVFEYKIDLLPRGRSPVMKLWLRFAPGRLLPQLHQNEVLQRSTSKSRI